MASTVDKIKAKVDNVLHKDKTNDPTHSTHTGTGVGNTTHTGTYGTTGAHTTGAHTTGTHGTTGYSDPTGPHDSHLGNKADPRVDSDHYGNVGNTSGAGGVGTGQYGSSTTHGTHGTTGGLTGGTHTGTHNTNTGYGSTTHGSDPSGPHDSKLANKLDPTVDTNSYGTVQGGHPKYDSNTTGYGSTTHGTTGSLTGGSHNTHGTTGYGSTTHGTTGGLTGGSHNTHGTTGEPLPKALTEDVSRANHHSSGHHTGATGGGLTGAHGQHGAANVGSGNSNKTAGPHNSDLLNKLDPRVDSDLDGSKTTGGNATYR
ncbi:hypothetical protein EK21DRAFT_108138 [Setomelanomma holmii]|uniref:Uncharacterized protein n=1 Tax=Setomelanomma holmii TaxID=210430 RepID=A0A9P4HG24_9PLEO|nr:hypothetical protein EK21DRAFT_108138 [Setomelanomma holmii]